MNHPLPLNITLGSATSRDLLRAFGNGSLGYVPAKLHEIDAPAGHQFAVGDKLKLHSLVDFADFNGDEVEVIGLRDSTEWGPGYYIKGRINEFLDYVHECRLTQ